MPDEPLYERDPAAWKAHLAEGNASQPRKRVGADVLIQNKQRRLLLVDPKYKPDWDIPGGMSEANEPPNETAKRELMEELGLDFHIGRLLVVDWVSPHGPWDDSLMFIFDGGLLNAKQIESLKLFDGELRAFEFCTEAQASERLRPYVWRRVRRAIEARKTGSAQFLRDGWLLSEK